MSKFSVWIDNVTNENTQSSDVFLNDFQRENGFRPGTGASAIRVNTALRQANLIAVAFVNALGISDDYDAKSSLSDIENWFKSQQLLKLPEIFSVGIENEIKKSIQPATNDAIDLGISSKRFKSIWIKDINFSGELKGADDAKVTLKSVNGLKNLDDTTNVVSSDTNVFIEKRELVYKGGISGSKKYLNIFWDSSAQYEAILSREFSFGSDELTVRFDGANPKAIHSCWFNRVQENIDFIEAVISFGNDSSLGATAEVYANIYSPSESSWSVISTSVTYELTLYKIMTRKYL